MNSLAPHGLRVQFWCSSSASAQSASPSHTQSRGMHFLCGGRLLAQVNSVAVHVRLAKIRRGKKKNPISHLQGHSSVTSYPIAHHNKQPSQSTGRSILYSELWGHHNGHSSEFVSTRRGGSLFCARPRPPWCRPRAASSLLWAGPLPRVRHERPDPA